MISFLTNVYLDYLDSNDLPMVPVEELPFAVDDLSGHEDWLADFSKVWDQALAVEDLQRRYLFEVRFWSVTESTPTCDFSTEVASCDVTASTVAEAVGRAESLCQANHILSWPLTYDHVDTKWYGEFGS